MQQERARLIRVSAFVVLVAAAAPVLLAALARAQPNIIPNDNKLAFMLFAVLLFVGETQPRLWMRFGEDGEVTPGWAFAYAMVLLGGPTGAVIVMVLANLYIDVRGHKGILRIVFNTSQVAVALSLGGLVLVVFGVENGITGDDHLPLRVGAAIVVAGLVTFVVNAALTAAVLCLHLAVSPITMMREAFALSVAVDGALLALAPVFVIAIEFSILMLPLLAITAFLVFHSARTALKREHEANHDPLTGLLNRRAFDERLTTGVEMAEYESQPLVLIMDLDRFKDINDRLGHAIGDKLLRSFAERLERVLPARSSAARLGGDEFAVIVMDVDSLDEAKLFVSRLHLQLSEQHLVSGFPLSAAVSIGAALAPIHGSSAAALLAAADLAMYRAKQFGSGIEFASTSDRPHDLGRVGLLADLTAAIGTDQIIVHYQPLVRLSDGTIESVEALIRWHHPVYGSISPDEFIGMAEQTDLIGPLTESVFRTAIEEVSTMGATMPKLCINVAARNLLDRQFANNMLAIMHELQFPGRLIEMEITERDIVTNSERSALTLARLRGAGIRIAIDDFGTGYSSFLTLRDLRADRLKIDQQFTRNMLDSNADELIVAKVIEIAHALGLDVVAEGVESAGVWQRLAELGCDVAQGYAIARPMDVDHLRDWFSRHNDSRRVGNRPFDSAELDAAKRRFEYRARVMAS